MTGALKNMFGAVVGSSKAALHITHPDGESFGRMIADLNRLVRSRLVVMDAITVMEGNGPVSGRLVDVGLLIVSADPVATDAVACRILGIDPLSIPFIRAAWESGLGAAREEEIEIRGADLARFTGRGLAIPARNPTRAIPPFLWRVAKDLLVAKPAIDPAVCIACGECVASCPTSPKSLAQNQGKVPSFDYSACIRCYCCQETCPQGAISVRPAPLAWLLGGRAERKRGSRGA
jgi:ferredoxin